MSGETLRDAALDELEPHASKHAQVIAQAELLLLAACLASPAGATFDDVRRDLGDLPEDFNPAAFGLVPRRLAKEGLIERAGYRASVRPSDRCKPLAVWRVTNAIAARRAVKGGCGQW